MNWAIAPKTERNTRSLRLGKVGLGGNVRPKLESNILRRESMQVPMLGDQQVGTWCSRFTRGILAWLDRPFRVPTRNPSWPIRSRDYNN